MREILRRYADGGTPPTKRPKLYNPYDKGTQSDATYVAPATPKLTQGDLLRNREDQKKRDDTNSLYRGQQRAATDDGTKLRLRAASGIKETEAEKKQRERTENFDFIDRTINGISVKNAEDLPIGVSAPARMWNNSLSLGAETYKGINDAYNAGLLFDEKYRNAPGQTHTPFGAALGFMDIAPGLGKAGKVIGKGLGKAGKFLNPFKKAENPFSRPDYFKRPDYFDREKDIFNMPMESEKKVSNYFTGKDIPKDNPNSNYYDEKGMPLDENHWFDKSKIEDIKKKKEMSGYNIEQNNANQKFSDDWRDYEKSKSQKQSSPDSRREVEYKTFNEGDVLDYGNGNTRRIQSPESNYNTQGLERSQPYPGQGKFTEEFDNLSAPFVHKRPYRMGFTSPDAGNNIKLNADRIINDRERKLINPEHQRDILQYGPSNPNIPSYQIKSEQNNPYLNSTKEKEQFYSPKAKINSNSDIFDLPAHPEAKTKDMFNKGDWEGNNNWNYDRNNLPSKYERPYKLKTKSIYI